MSSLDSGTSPVEVSQRIQVVRGQRVLLDSDLAALYGVTAKRLNEQVRRNAERFPEDFVLRLTNQALSLLRSQTATLKPRVDASLRSQSAILKTGRGQHRKYPRRAVVKRGKSGELPQIRR
jgi:hypothetical protein